MPAPEIRPFARHDRDGLTALANRHIAAVLPGGAVPVSTLLSQMERDSTEPIIDPWVVERATIVGVAADRVVAAAHLKRYGVGPGVSASYRDTGVNDWLVCDPSSADVGASVLASAMDQLAAWGVRAWGADGSLPSLGVYGIPDAWPHVRLLLEDAGFDDEGGQIEVLFAGALADVPPPPDEPPVAGVELVRVVGRLGTSFEAVLDGERIGVFEVADAYGVANALLARWADEGNHWVLPAWRGRGVGSWLLRHGCAWLRLGGKDRLLTYAIERRAAEAPPLDETAEACAHYYARHGLVPLGRTRRGWQRVPR